MTAVAGAAEGAAGDPTTDHAEDRSDEVNSGDTNPGTHDGQSEHSPHAQLPQKAGGFREQWMTGKEVLMLQ